MLQTYNNNIISDEYLRRSMSIGKRGALILTNLLIAVIEIRSFSI